MSDEPKFTPASEWKKDHDEGVPVTLSSGRIVYLRPVNTKTFLESGKIPDFMSDQVEKMMQRQLGIASPDQPQVMTVEEVQLQNEIIDIFCCTCIVKPAVVRKPHKETGPEEVSITLFSDDEKQEIFSMLGKSTRYIREFFRQQEASLVALYDLENVRKEAERAYGNKRVNKKSKPSISS